MQFQAGQRGNPNGSNGRPRGARNRRTLVAERLFDEHAETLTNAAIDLAREGHAVALRLCMERVLPMRDRPVPFDLPPMATANDAAGAIGCLVDGIADGDLTPTEAMKMAKLVQVFARTLSTAELERKLAELGHERT